jgi:glycosyltransferase involved in cell wall biosynthesis
MRNGVDNRESGQSVIITAHNESDELCATVDSLYANTRYLHQCIIVDDASTDGCCKGVSLPNTCIIRHPSRQGVAPSRLEAASFATGDVLAFFVAPQRVSRGCVDRCRDLALRRRSIVTPVVQGFKSTNRLIYGASFRMCPEMGLFSARWLLKRPLRRTRRISALRAPAYVIPRSIFDRVCWIRGMRGWGGSEAVVSVKAFFAGVDILSLRGPIAWHRFRPAFHYEVSWDEVWRNHALIARVCFDERTWYEYWLPEVFDGHLTEQTKCDLESESIIRQHNEFMGQRVRPDHDFWHVLLRQELPASLR